MSMGTGTSVRPVMVMMAAAMMQQVRRHTFGVHNRRGVRASFDASELVSSQHGRGQHQ